jgi:hypothetical protein
VASTSAGGVDVEVVDEPVEATVEDGKTSKRRDSVRPDSNTTTRSYDPVGRDPVYNTAATMRGGVICAPVRE